MYSYTTLANVAVAAVLTAGLYAVMSYGLSLIYGVMKIVNLSHAGTMMFGAFAVFTLHHRLGLDPILGSLLLAPVFFVAGMALYRLLVQRLADAPPIASLLLLFALWLVLQNIAYLIWGTEDQSVVTPYTYSTWTIGGVAFPYTRVIVFVVALVVLAAMYLFLKNTYLGKAIRATAQNPRASRVVGIRVEWVSMVSFGLGTALAAFAGGLLTLLYSFNPDFGGVFQLKSFTIIVLGGLESFAGVALGAFVLAMIESFAVLFMRASLQNLIAFVLLVVALVVLPHGLASLFGPRRT